MNSGIIQVENNKGNINFEKVRYKNEREKEKMILEKV